MTGTSADLPGQTNVGRQADQPVDRDERHVRATIDALNRGAGPGGMADEAETAALRALLGYGDVAEVQPGARTAR